MPRISFCLSNGTSTSHMPSSSPTGGANILRELFGVGSVNGIKITKILERTDIQKRWRISARLDNFGMTFFGDATTSDPIRIVISQHPIGPRLSFVAQIYGFLNNPPQITGVIRRLLPTDKTEIERHIDLGVTPLIEANAKARDFNQRVIYKLLNIHKKVERKCQCNPTPPAGLNLDIELRIIPMTLILYQT
uniref:Uncharacterized protein n=1 Tax=Romanomermis culicivorax TaxID=13658 RepID=A0A915KGK3_ROMCU